MNVRSTLRPRAPRNNLTQLLDLLRPDAFRNYPLGTQIQASNLVSQDLALTPERRILSLLESYNSEPMLPGNGFILLNKAGNVFRMGAPLSALEALLMVQNNKRFVIRLARVRPSSENRLRQVKLCPIPEFQYQIEDTRSLIKWWRNIGTNFCDGIF